MNKTSPAPVFLFYEKDAMAVAFTDVTASAVSWIERTNRRIAFNGRQRSISIASTRFNRAPLENGLSDTFVQSTSCGARDVIPAQCVLMQ
jgi:hypothetical protein